MRWYSFIITLCMTYSACCSSSSAAHEIRASHQFSATDHTNDGQRGNRIIPVLHPRCCTCSGLLLAHCVVMLRCGSGSLSAHSGHRVSRTNQSRFMSTRCPAGLQRLTNKTISPPAHYTPCADRGRSTGPAHSLESGLSPRERVQQSRTSFATLKLSSRIAASRNSDLVRNFGWHLMQKIAPTRKPGLQQVIGQSVHRFKPTSNPSTKVRCASTPSGPQATSQEKLENN